MPAESATRFELAGRTFNAVTNPWRADLFTAGLSTGIANIRAYSVFPGFVVRMMRGKQLWLRDLLLGKLLRYLPEGPSERQLQRGRTFVKAVVSDGVDERSVAFVGPEAYLFTALCIREIAASILAGRHAAGYRTPAWYGKPLLERIGSIKWH